MGKRYVGACSEKGSALSNLTRQLARTKISMLRVQSQQHALEIFECFHCYKFFWNLILVSWCFDTDGFLFSFTDMNAFICLLPTEYCMPKHNKNWFLFFLFRMYFFKVQGLWIYKPHSSACVDYIFLSHRQGLVNWSLQESPTAREKLSFIGGHIPRRGNISNTNFFFFWTVSFWSLFY